MSDRGRINAVPPQFTVASQQTALKGQTTPNALTGVPDTAYAKLQSVHDSKATFGKPIRTASQQQRLSVAYAYAYFPFHSL